MDFWKDLSENKDMAEELLQELSSAEEEIRTKKCIEKDKAIIEFARSKGYEITEEDMELAKAKAVKLEMSDEDLKLLAAGASDKEMREYCIADYLCRVAWNTCLASNECSDNYTTCKTALRKPTWSGPSNCTLPVN